MSDPPQAEPTIGIITALHHEYAAVQCMMEHGKNLFVPDREAHQRYYQGQMPAAERGMHTVVLALATTMGTNVAATWVANLVRDFPKVHKVIMVGIAAGVPYPEKPEHHVRLGDIVVSDQRGVVQYDFVRQEPDRIVPKHSAHRPSSALVHAARLLLADEMRGHRPWVDPICRASELRNAARPNNATDILYRFERAQDGNLTRTKIEHPPDKDRVPGEPRVFLGPVASSNTLQRDPLRRNALRDQFGVKAIEMEGSGIADATWIERIEYLIVRGICDYADPAKNDLWQVYAAVVAAAYTRALLSQIASAEADTLRSRLSTSRVQRWYRGLSGGERVARIIGILGVVAALCALTGILGAPIIEQLVGQYLVHPTATNALTPTITPTFTPTPTATPMPMAFPTAAKGESLIIVADFDNRSNGHRGMDPAQRIYDKLKDKVKSDALDVRIERLPQVVDDNTARSVGEIYNATLVLWGWYDNLSATPRIEQIGTLYEYHLAVEEEYLFLGNSEKAELHLLYTDLPCQVACLTLLVLGTNEYVSGNYDLALGYLDSALATSRTGCEHSIDLITIYLYRGNVYYYKADYEKALADYTKIIDRDCEDAILYYNRGCIYYKLEEYERALEDYTKSIELNQHYSAAYYNRAITYRCLGEYEKALGDHDKVIETLDPENADAYNSRGTTYKYMDQYKKAENDYTEAIVLNPEGAKAYYNRGLLYKETDQNEKAIADFERFLEIAHDPNWCREAEGCLRELRGE